MLIVLPTLSIDVDKHRCSLMMIDNIDVKLLAAACRY